MYLVIPNKRERNPKETTKNGQSRYIGNNAVNLDCPFLVVSFVFVFLVMCIVCPLLPVYLDCPFLVRDNQEWTIKIHWQQWTHNTHDEENKNKRDNQEWTIQIHWQQWTHNTHDEDNKNKRDHSWLSLLFLFSSSCVLCVHCCQ
jgi:hypothetical protein